MKKMIYLGVVGQIACGKGVLVDALKKHGFVSFSLSTVVHDELEKQGIKKFTRKTMQDIGDQLRKRYGRDVLAKRAIEILRKQTLEAGSWKLEKKAESSKLENLASSLQLQDQASSVKNPAPFIIEGIRNTAEVEYLKSLPNFTIIGIKAKREIRFHRLVQRRKPWDPKTWKEFLEVDRRDLGIGQKSEGQQVGRCLAYCDYIITNNKSRQDFEKKVKKLLQKILKKT